MLGSVVLLSALAACARSPEGASRSAVEQAAPSDAVRPPGEGANPPGTGTVYTADEGSSSISAVDVASGRTRSVHVGIAPHNVQISSDGSTLFAVGSSHEHLGQGTLLVIRPQDIERPRAFITVANHPAHVVVDRAGERAYVTNSADDTLAVVDLGQERTLRVIAVCGGPHGLRMSPDEREIWVACVDSGEVGVVDVARGELVERVAVGRAPVQVGFTPDGQRVYVTLRDDDAVAVVDAATRRVRSTVPVGRGPVQLHATPDGRLVYVANQGTEDQPDERVSVIDSATDEVVATLTTAAGAHGVAVSGDGAWVFVTNTFADSLSFVDVSAQRVVRTVAVGGRPGGVTWSPVTEEGPAPE